MRRRCRRRLNFTFDKRYFKPRGIPLSQLGEIKITDDELETLRLRFIKKLTQNEAAQKMNISQSQYQRDLTNTLEKVTSALIDGHAICIDKINNFSKSKTVKILIPMNSKDKTDKISDVFGRSKYFAIYNSDDKKLEFVENPGNTQARGAGTKASQFAIENQITRVIVRQIGPNAENALKQGDVEITIESEPDKTLEELIQSL